MPIAMVRSERIAGKKIKPLKPKKMKNKSVGPFTVELLKSGSSPQAAKKAKKQPESLKQAATPPGRKASTAKTPIISEVITKRAKSTPKIKLEKKNAKSTTNRTIKKKKPKAQLKSTEKKHTKTALNEVSVRIENNDKIKKPTLASLNMSQEQILQGIKAVLALRMSNQKQLFTDDLPIHMEINCIKIPTCPKRIVRIALPHSLVKESQEVCLIVCDLVPGKRHDHEPTVCHYEDLLRKAGVTRKINVLPMRQLRTEFTQFELKRRLLTVYDTFLVDGRVSGHVMHHLGSTFYESRRNAVPIKINSDLKAEIERGLSKTQLYQSSKGCTTNVHVGNTGMPAEHVADNVEAVCKALAEVYPGGWNNVRSLYLKMTGTAAVPIYLSLRNPNEVPVPKVKGITHKMSQAFEGELSTLLNASVIVRPGGRVEVKRKPFKKHTTKDYNNDKGGNEADYKEEDYKEEEEDEEEEDEDSDKEYDAAEEEYLRHLHG